MNRDFLKKLGLADDVIESVMAEHGKDVQGEREKGAKAYEAASAGRHFCALE